jgi:ABC-type Fe3+-hydroxamate transport system substrate-binding protein
LRKFQDQIGRVFELKNTPKRIISLVPSQTELLVDLGLIDSIVGITKFCVHPTYLKQQKEIVGGTKNINIDKIKALQPDIILCNKEENTQEIVSICEQIATTHVSDIYTIQDTLTLINQYGNLFYHKVEALKIIDEINSRLHDFQQFIKNKEVKKVAYFIWKNPWMTAGTNNFINHLLGINNFKNVYANKARYPEVDIFKLTTVDVVLLSSEPFPFKEKHIKELKEIIPNAKILLVDGELFSWYGSRLIQSFDYFKKLQNRI